LRNEYFQQFLHAIGYDPALRQQDRTLLAWRRTLLRSDTRLVQRYAPVPPLLTRLGHTQPIFAVMHNATLIQQCGRV
jgi:hypothetical protein